MRKVISNTTPLIALSEIGHLHILKDLYTEISIPEAVFNEVKKEPAYTDIRMANWIRVESVSDFSNRDFFRARLHTGEVEVMLLAEETAADLVILDDNLARKTAQYIGLTVTGTVGVVIKAKQLGIINSTNTVIEKLIENGLYVSDDVREIALRESGEA